MKLPKLPWRERCNLMVRTGQAKDFYAAASMLSKRRKRPALKSPDASTARLPYKE